MLWIRSACASQDLLPGRLLLGFFGIAQRRIVLDIGKLGEQIREHECVRVVGLEKVAPLLGEIGVVLAFLDREEEFFLEVDKRGLSIRVFVEFELSLVDEFAQVGILHHARKSLVARLAEFQFEHYAPGFVPLSRIVQFLRLGRKPVAEHGLLADELLNERFEAIILVGRDRRRATDDERCAGFIDEDRVHFVDDRIVMRTLNLLVATRRHAVVPQVVETKLAIGAVGNVALILRPANLRQLIVLDDADREPQKRVQLAHPLRIAACEIVIHRDDMNPASRQGIEVDGQGGHQGLAFAGGHLGDAPAMQHHSTDQLHIKMHHTPGHRLVADGK